MLASQSHGAERRELEEILASGIFTRAPSLSQILTYICEMHFAGRRDEIKEYNIAVEALGRTADFDPKRDSIVRVEAFRLRKRLAEYYQRPGAGREVRVELRPGSYVPEFIPQSMPAAVPLTAPPPSPIAAAPSSRKKLVWSTAAGLTAAVVLFAGVRHLVPKIPALAVPAGPQIRIRAGSAEMYADRLGRVWLPDGYASGGSTAAAGKPVRGAWDAQLYEFYREGTFHYDIPAPAGVYELRLYFFEPLFGAENGIEGGEGSRVMNVALNGSILARDVDAFAEAGRHAADLRVFKDVTPAKDGLIHLAFTGTGRGAVLSAIEITPGIPGVAVPVRMISRDTPYVDQTGRLWDVDRFVAGGRLVFRSSRIAAAGDDPELYRGERYGSLTYTVPVPKGRYTLILRFAETWFGPDHPGGGGAGERIFDILCNGVILQRNFDVYREAGGADRGLRKVFHGIEPNAQGKIVLTLSPQKNYAELNSLEILDQAQ